MPFNEIAEHRARTALKDNALEAAVTILMKTYGDEIYRFSQSMLNNAADAQDVLQTIFIQAYQGFDNFHGKSNFRTWLYAIARNRCLDHLKKNRRLNKRVEFVEVVPDQLDPINSDLNDSNDPRVAEILRRCLSHLSKNVRTAVLLRFQSDYSYEEAAHIVREKAGTLQARVTRALPALRRCVEEHGLVL